MGHSLGMLPNSTGHKILPSKFLNCITRKKYYLLQFHLEKICLTVSKWSYLRKSSKHHSLTENKMSEIVFPKKTYLDDGKYWKFLKLIVFEQFELFFGECSLIYSFKNTRTSNFTEYYKRIVVLKYWNFDLGITDSLRYTSVEVYF